MKILMVADSIMLHLERGEATALAHVLDSHNSEANKDRARLEYGVTFAEIVRQIDICLNAGIAGEKK